MDKKVDATELQKIRSLIENIQRRDSIDFFNGDKREVFDRLISLENKLSALTSSVKELTNNLPCKEHNDRIIENMKSNLKHDTKLQKSKLTIIMASISILVSLFTTAGVIIQLTRFAEAVTK